MFDALTLIYSFISSYNSGDRKIGYHMLGRWTDIAGEIYSINEIRIHFTAHVGYYLEQCASLPVFATLCAPL